MQNINPDEDEKKGDGGMGGMDRDKNPDDTDTM
jgi:hypothetical protein